jgi:hypothetical protein
MIVPTDRILERLCLSLGYCTHTFDRSAGRALFRIPRPPLLQGCCHCSYLSRITAGQLCSPLPYSTNKVAPATRSWWICEWQVEILLQRWTPHCWCHDRDPDGATTETLMDRVLMYSLSICIGVSVVRQVRDVTVLLFLLISSGNINFNCTQAITASLIDDAPTQTLLVL